MRHQACDVEPCRDPGRHRPPAARAAGAAEPAGVATFQWAWRRVPTLLARVRKRLRHEAVSGEPPPRPPTPPPTSGPRRQRPPRAPWPAAAFRPSLGASGRTDDAA